MAPPGVEHGFSRLTCPRESPNRSRSPPIGVQRDGCRRILLVAPDDVAPVRHVSLSCPRRDNPCGPCVLLSWSRRRCTSVSCVSSLQVRRCATDPFTPLYVSRS